MVKENIALRGWVGEKIVEKWLNKIYPNYKIIPQIVPNKGIKGGGHLDFGVIKDNKVIAIYEVKTQDYPIEKINRAFEYLSKNNRRGLEFKIQDNKDNNERFYSEEDMRVSLVLLKKPSKRAEKYIEIDAVTKIYFYEIFNKLGDEIHSIKEQLSERAKKLVPEEMDNLIELAKKGK